MSASPQIVEANDTAEDVARALGVSVRTVQRRAQNQEIPHYRVGDQPRFNVAEVLDATRIPIGGTTSR